MRLTSRLAKLESSAGVREPSGTIEFHFPDGAAGPLDPYVPCDLRDQHGPDCVMSVSPANHGVRFMRIISGVKRLE